MKVIIVFLVFAFCYAVKWNELENYTYEQYINDFSKDKDDLRKTIFEERLKNILTHNSDDSKTWKKGVNQFTDRTDSEIRAILGVKKGLLKPNTTPSTSKIDLNTLPVSVDWRDKGIITPVKDQGVCGSCWSFGASETVESYWAKSTGRLVELSEQQILDCTPNPKQCGGTGGCGGGTAELAYDKIMEIGGLTTEWKYPYTSYFGSNHNCSFNPNTRPYAKLSTYKNLPSNEYEPFMETLATTGPLVVNVDATYWSDYETGVLDCNQTNVDINHVVQLVGYGTDSQHGDYWLIRNSWSPSWGEDGYIRLTRQANSTCNVDKSPGDGTGCNGGPSTVVVCGPCGLLYDGLYPVVQ